MLKKLFLFALLLLSVISCNNNILKPDDYSKENIDKKYPYWKIGVADFKIDNTLKEYTTIKVEEKRRILKCLAMMRLVINTEEFANEVYKKQGQLRSYENDEYNGKKISSGDKYDIKRVVEVVRSVDRDFDYIKGDVPVGVGVDGKSRYLRYGLQPDNEIPTGSFVKFLKGDWITSLTGVNDITQYLFHEHLHNIGFRHKDGANPPKDDNVPYVLHFILHDIRNRILSGDLKDKYSKQLDELTAYYLTEYKYLLSEDTVFDPSKK